MSAYDFDFEKFSLSKDDFKDLIYEEIMLYHSDEAAFEYIKNKRKYPDGALHLRFGNRFRKAYRGDNEGGPTSGGSASDSMMNNEGKAWQGKTKRNERMPW